MHTALSTLHAKSRGIRPHPDWVFATPVCSGKQGTRTWGACGMHGGRSKSSRKQQDTSAAPWGTWERTPWRPSRRRRRPCSPAAGPPPPQTSAWRSALLRLRCCCCCWHRCAAAWAQGHPPWRPAPPPAWAPASGPPPPEAARTPAQCPRKLQISRCSQYMHVLALVQILQAAKGVQQQLGHGPWHGAVMQVDRAQLVGCMHLPMRAPARTPGLPGRCPGRAPGRPARARARRGTRLQGRAGRLAWAPASASAGRRVHAGQHEQRALVRPAPLHGRPGDLI